MYPTAGTVDDFAIFLWSSLAIDVAKFDPGWRGDRMRGQDRNV